MCAKKARIGERIVVTARWDQDVRDYAQLTLFFCNPLTDCAVLCLSTLFSPEQTLGKQNVTQRKKAGISAQKQLFVVFGIYRLSDASLLCDAKHFFFSTRQFLRDDHYCCYWHDKTN